MTRSSSKASHTRSLDPKVEPSMHSSFLFHSSPTQSHPYTPSIMSDISPEVQALFDQHELSGDRQLNFDELYNLIIKVDSTITEDTLQDLMDSFDTNYNDKLSLNEFSHLYKMVVERKKEREAKA
ncbi:hypothetical protein BKA57DRAFT_540351 [Linnemannia elongata]|nr:hypothetical protein BKA57DRAFT_540351 [Linnemannia elongata]